MTLHKILWQRVATIELWRAARKGLLSTEDAVAIRRICRKKPDYTSILEGNTFRYWHHSLARWCMIHWWKSEDYLLRFTDFVGSFLFHSICTNLLTRSLEFLLCVHILSFACRRFGAIESLVKFWFFFFILLSQGGQVTMYITLFRCSSLKYSQSQPTIATPDFVIDHTSYNTLSYCHVILSPLLLTHLINWVKTTRHFTYFTVQ